jgi:hypothetical protein
MIPRKFIFAFLRKATQIDSNSHTLIPELLDQINNLIDLIQIKLVVVDKITCGASICWVDDTVLKLSALCGRIDVGLTLNLLQVSNFETQSRVGINTQSD